MTVREAIRSPFRARVEEGAAWLDDLLGPSWIDSIDLEEFDLLDPCLCVLGQIEGSFYNACVVFGIDYPSSGETERTMPKAHALGFFENCLDDEEPLAGEHRNLRWHVLQQEWASLIRERKGEAA